MLNTPKNYKAGLFLLALIITRSALSKDLPFKPDLHRLFLNNLTEPYKIPKHYIKINVSTSLGIYQAVHSANNSKHDTAIILNDGIYHIPHTINITVDNLILKSKNSEPDSVVLSGKGMKATKDVDNLIRVTGSGFILEGLTLEKTGNHLLQIAGEYGATKPKIRNSIFRDGYEQLIKVTYSKKNHNKYAADGVIEHCFFYYSAGIGPNYYIGGIDAHGIKGWYIKNNIFSDITSPNESIAEHAIHLWDNTKNNIVKNNIIFNSDRGIGFGMRIKNNNFSAFSNYAGEIKNNLIYHNKDNKFSDVGIILEDSPHTIIKDNIIYLAHNYPNGIEFRFNKTIGVNILNNTLNKGIMRRDGASARIFDNHITHNSDITFIEQISKWPSSVIK